MKQDNETLKAEVRAHYGAFAAAELEAVGCCAGDCCAAEAAPLAERACCGTACCGAEAPTMATGLYGDEVLATIPAEVAATTRGCGNPLAKAALRPGDVVVDLGSGGGLDAFLAAQAVGEAGFVYGVDMTDAMLELATRNAAKVGAANVAFLKGDIEALPLPDHHIDVVISNCVVNLAPDKGAALGEALRVLRPGGRLAISDIVVDGTLADLPIPEATLRSALSWAGCVAGAPTAAAYRGFLETAGFEAIEIVIESRYTLEDLGAQETAALLGLAPDVAAELAGRFASARISARRPQEAAPTEPTLRRAYPGDWRQLAGLLEALALPLAGAREHLSDFVVAEQAGRIVGAAGLERYGEVGLLRSVAVAPAAQGRGLGGALVAAIEAQAAQAGVRSLALLTTTAEGYFAARGYVPLSREAAPTELQASREWAEACPASAALLLKAL